MARIDKYHIAQFDNDQDCTEFRSALISFTNTPSGLRFWNNEPRCVVWVSYSDFSLLYLSPGAVLAAEEAGLRVRLTEEIEADKLPSDKTLLLGYASDWEQRRSPAE